MRSMSKAIAALSVIGVLAALQSEVQGARANWTPWGYPSTVDYTLSVNPVTYSIGRDLGSTDVVVEVAGSASPDPVVTYNNEFGVAIRVAPDTERSSTAEVTADTHTYLTVNSVNNESYNLHISETASVSWPWEIQAYPSATGVIDICAKVQALTDADPWDAEPYITVYDPSAISHSNVCVNGLGSSGGQSISGSPVIPFVGDGTVMSVQLHGNVNVWTQQSIAAGAQPAAPTSSPYVDPRVGKLPDSGWYDPEENPEAPEKPEASGDAGGWPEEGPGGVPYPEDLPDDNVYTYWTKHGRWTVVGGVATKQAGWTLKRELHFVMVAP